MRIFMHAAETTQSSSILAQAKVEAVQLVEPIRDRFAVPPERKIQGIVNGCVFRLFLSFNLIGGEVTVDRAISGHSLGLELRVVRFRHYRDGRIV